MKSVLLQEVYNLLKPERLDITREIGWQTESEWWLGPQQVQQGFLLATQQLLMGCENIQTMCSITDSCRKPLHTPCSSSSSGTHNTNPLGSSFSLHTYVYWTTVSQFTIVLKDRIDFEVRPIIPLCKPGLHIIVVS